MKKVINYNATLPNITLAMPIVSIFDGKSVSYSGSDHKIKVTLSSPSATGCEEIKEDGDYKAYSIAQQGNTTYIVFMLQDLEPGEHTLNCNIQVGTNESSELVININIPTTRYWMESEEEMAYIPLNRLGRYDVAPYGTDKVLKCYLGKGYKTDGTKYNDTSYIYLNANVDKLVNNVVDYWRVDLPSGIPDPEDLGENSGVVRDKKYFLDNYIQEFAMLNNEQLAVVESTSANGVLELGIQFDNYHSLPSILSPITEQGFMQLTGISLDTLFAIAKGNYSRIYHNSGNGYRMLWQILYTSYSEAENEFYISLRQYDEVGNVSATIQIEYSGGGLSAGCF